jgi:hypothetical protein
MMAKDYYVVQRETCPICKGEQYIYNEIWRECLDEIGAKATGEEILAWFNENHEPVYNMKDLPPEENICINCDGKGEVESEIALYDALWELEGTIRTIAA